MEGEATERSDNVSRREFMQRSAVVSVAVLAGQLGTRAYAAGDEKIRVGLIGCGGRGTDSIRDCVTGSKAVELVAMGDLFKDRLKRSYSELANGDKERERPPLGEPFKVPKEQTFAGFDAYEKVLACDIDMVIQATPPHFRPMHLKAAIEAGKHVFMEKPAGVDPVGIRKVIEAAKLAEQKGLAIVAGTQRRHQKHYVELMQRVRNGDIGEILAAQCYWCGGDMIGYWKWHEPSEAATQFEWQLRNWPWFVWTSGDHYVEQHVHNIDIINWALDAHPVKALGMGGRQVRKEGNIWDHFAVEYEYENGVRLSSMARQINGCSDRVSEHLVGMKGTCYTDGSSGKIEGQNAYEYNGPNPNPYVMEHIDLVNSILEGRPLNEGVRVAESTLAAIMGRMSAYTGRELSWKWVMEASKLDLSPESYDVKERPIPPVAMPGQTLLI